LLVQVETEEVRGVLEGDRRLEKKIQAGHALVDDNLREQVGLESGGNGRNHLVADARSFQPHFGNACDVAEPMCDFEELASLETERALPDAIEDFGKRRGVIFLPGA